MFLVFVGYDLAAEGGVKAMLTDFEREVGLHYLKAIHLNDSKGSVRTFTQIFLRISISQMFFLSELYKSLGPCMDSTLLRKVSPSFLAFVFFSQAN